MAHFSAATQRELNYKPPKPDGRSPAAVRASLAEPSKLGGSPVSLLDKVSDILRCFEMEDVDLTLGELARRTGIPKSTVHRLINKLVELGMLDRSDHGYRLGLRLVELGVVALMKIEIVAVAQPVLVDLYTTTGATVHLAVLDNIDVFYMLKRGPGNGPKLPSYVGGRMRAYCTAIGKALLAFAPRTDRAMSGERSAAPHVPTPAPSCAPISSWVSCVMSATEPLHSNTRSQPPGLCAWRPRSSERTAQ